MCFRMEKLILLSVGFVMLLSPIDDLMVVVTGLWCEDLSVVMGNWGKIV